MNNHPIISIRQKALNIAHINSPTNPVIKSLQLRFGTFRYYKMNNTLYEKGNDSMLPEFKWDRAHATSTILYTPRRRPVLLNIGPFSCFA